ncbi:MAG: MFS transporter [Aquidulcibacter sp.]|jgi:maltose/moltooligosaccharide transporter|uniref:MFS transporter n=1 Tax=Aquidulcibacter sp. TaxID=2052990 RepID=UPI0022CCA820|nr:MFS transporter [Aquidulcibacter sp.]MCE2891858.1 MFS transporter [Hyphomonadaceae bacterium]MCZ8206745.1 MFS transporter [Aquidulcibacter sp.]
MTQPAMKPHLPLWRIAEMNLGFLGLQFSFGLQQGNMGPIYSYLGADEASLPLLQLAGPLTGLLVQPIIGAMSDRTASKWGRRTPYFIVGAVMCSLGLFFMPLSSSILMAVSLLWILDAGNNITMEPYRAYVSDRLNPDQRQFGFLSQSAFTGLAQMLAFLSPSIMINLLGFDVNAVDAHNIPETTKVAFTIGAVLSISTILWSVFRVRELPLTEAELAYIKSKPLTVSGTLLEIWDAIVTMPQVMRKLALMSLFQWYGMAAYWGYIIYSIGRSVYGTSEAVSEGFRMAVVTNGEIGGFYNGIAFIAAFAMVPFTKRFGPEIMHAFCLTLGGIGMLFMPHISDKALLFIPAIGIGLAWASIMGNPFVILSGAVPPERTGVYMGIFNMMIVIPMLLIAATLPFYYKPLMGGDPRHVITMAGIMLMIAAVCVLWVRDKRPA